MHEPLKSFRRHLRLAFVIPILLTGLVGGVFVAQTAYLRHSFRTIEAGYRAETLARTVLGLSLDMETGLRGYLLTGEDHYLQPYRLAEPQVEPTLDNLLVLVRSNSEEYRAVIRIKTYYREWHANAQKMMELRRQDGPVLDAALYLEGKELMDLIRRDCDQVMTAEQDRVQLLLGTLMHNVERTFMITIVLSLLLGSLLAVFSRKELALVAGSYDHALGTAKARTEEFRENQRWLQAVLGSIGDAVIVTESTGRIVFTNPVAKRMLADGIQLLAGTHTTEIIHLVDELSRESVPDGHQQVMETGEPVLPTTRLILVRNDGSEIPVSLGASPFRDEKGNAIGVVIVLRDLTQQRLSERALQSSEKLASIGRVAASVAHEIHNPLDALGNLLYLLEHQSMEESAKTYVRLAREELERVTSISEQMLTFSREARQPQRVCLGQVMEDVLTLFMPRIRRMSVVLVKQYSVQDGVVVALPGEMRQVFSNLVGNALDAMNGPGRLVLRIENSFNWSKPSDTGVRVMVCDSGPGIATEVRRNLMEPFVTSKGEKGTGLGLWVCRGIVEKYHGSLRFYSSTVPEKSGTCFSVFLPTGGAQQDGATESVVERRAG